MYCVVHVAIKTLFSFFTFILHTHTRVRAHTHIHTHTYTQRHTHTYTHTHTHTHTQRLKFWIFLARWQSQIHEQTIQRWSAKFIEAKFKFF